jgi:hypothetical protein
MVTRFRSRNFRNPGACGWPTPPNWTTEAGAWPWSELQREWREYTVEPRFCRLNALSGSIGTLSGVR